MSSPPQGFFSVLTQTRYNFGLLALGASYVILLRFGTILTTRKLRGTDGLAAICMALWLLYLTGQVVDIWNRTTRGVAITNWVWVLNSVTLCYSAVLCAIVYMSALRLTKLFAVELGSWWQKCLEWVSLGYVACVFAIRLARTTLMFLNTNASTTNPALSQQSTNLQLATFLPSLLLKCIMDAVAIYKLYLSRAKFIVSAGREAFHHIVHTLVIEIVLLIVACIVAFQEALNYADWKLSFFDWILFSWCLASWIDQRKQLAAIFGSQMGSTRDTDTEAGISSQAKATGSFSDASKTVVSRHQSEKRKVANDL